MNRKEIEKEFDSRFTVWVSLSIKSQMKSYFFNKILPEILRDIIQVDPDDFSCWGNEKIYKLRDKVKEKYNITL